MVEGGLDFVSHWNYRGWPPRKKESRKRGSSISNRGPNEETKETGELCRRVWEMPRRIGFGAPKGREQKRRTRGRGPTSFPTKNREKRDRPGESITLQGSVPRGRPIGKQTFNFGLTHVTKNRIKKSKKRDERKKKIRTMKS